MTDRNTDRGTDEGSRVLLVEPDQQFARILQARLQASGFSTCIAASAREALALFPDRTIGFVVTELDLPDLDGLELGQRLVSREHAPEIVVCTRSPSARSWDADTLQRLRIRAVHVRPTRVDEIVQTIETLRNEPKDSLRIDGIRVPAVEIRRP